MIAFLLIALIVIDMVLIGAVYLLNSRRMEDLSAIQELTQERHLLNEMRKTIEEELSLASSKSQSAIERVTQLAMEAEQEVKTGSSTLAKELESIIGQLSARFESPLMELTKRQSALEALLRKFSQEKQLIQNSIERGEKICRLFNENMPIETVIKEIEDKKFADARQMLAQGYKADEVSSQLGISKAEVRLLAGI